MARLRGIKKLWFAHRKHRKAGFTLIELLVSMVIGTIITVALLSLVVDLNNTNQKDTSRSETQRDMQLAMNYITQDLREAVYVYDGECLQGSGTATTFGTFCPGVVNHIPAKMSANNADGQYIPVLAFWRADPIPDPVQQQCRVAAQNSQANPDDDNNALNTLIKQGVPCVSSKTYTLVVYAIVNPPDTIANSPWQGRARLVRYQFSQFNSAGAANPGWVNPLPDPSTTFQQWPYQASNAAIQPNYVRPSNDPDVLVDFLDDTDASTLNANQQPNCKDPSDTSATATTNPRYVITPKAPTGNVRSFFACVRGKTLTASELEQSVNQEVRLVLTGNVAGRGGFPLNSASTSRLFPLQTRVLIRGSINKRPQ
ncbi:prepilin-type N-terminal cleavage/methylation domain-containing protein [Kovacikia minuta CCNUW1]|uniref:PilW family protein n=1 Tax=Kovacikia minuta TaxID=2931930 RepID=UPI001CCEDF53|nr:prepilin-type N-terminal cleavage/methylation domain-containing protein [Kovacikia minuta]UBF24497.1 prepilin-type N-terminal cleavage/methylation domain-containing protein [Kovacikia minuta CCNUW1]